MSTAVARPGLSEQVAPGAATLREPRVHHPISRRLWLASFLLALTTAGLVTAVLVTSRGAASIDRLATVRLDTDTLLTELKDVETGQRGFLLTGDPLFLQPYEEARPRIPALLDRLLAGAGAADPGLPLAALRQNVERKLERTDATIAMARQGQLEETRSAVARGQGKRVMDAIRAQLQQVAASVDRRRAKIGRQTGGLAVLAAAVSLATAALASLLLGWTAWQQRQRSAEHLRLSEENRALALDAAGLGTWEWDARTDCLKACATTRRLLGLSGDPAPGFSDLVGPLDGPDRVSAEDALREASRNDAWEWEGWVGQASADPRRLLLRAGLYRDRDGRPTVLRGVVQDLTARHFAEQRLRDAQLELLHVTRVTTIGEAASATAHELAQPLSAAATIFKSCDMVLRSGRPHDREHLLAGMASGLNALGRASDIVRNFSRFLRKQALRRERFQLNPALREAVEIGAVDFERRGGGHIRWHLAAELPPIEGDRTQVQQVAVNLVRNAVEAMAGMPARDLTVATERRGDHVRMTVGDTGPGLADAARTALFRPFTTTKPAGLGLGLSICKTIVDAHGGTIEAISTPDGTTFAVEFPAAEDARRAGAA